MTLKVDTSKAKRSMDRAAAELNKSINGISKKQVSFNVNSKSFTQPLGRITASANEFTKSLEASNARVIAFGASVGVINAISDAFKSLVAETVKFEKVLQDINVVVGASSGRLKEFGDGLFNVAKNTAQAFTISAEAALEFSRQGLTMEETLRRTNDALILTRLTGLDAASAVSGLTAAVNAFGDAGLSTTDIIDKLAAVDVKFAVSSEDLIKALERTGAVAIDAGVEIDSLIGLVTALQQTTARGGAVIGNGLKTIFTRIQRPESIRQLEEMGIAVKNLSGAILPADKIMLNMAKTFDNLSQSQQSNIVQFSAGIFQANVFRAALRDLSKEQSIQAQATEIAGNAAGDAAQKNEMLNKTMAAMASQTSTSIQELAETLGSLGLAPDIELFLSSIKDGIDGIKNTLGGGEDEGSTFAKGLVKGIGNVITGPAAIAFGAIFIKLFVNIAKFAKTSLKDVLGIVNEKDKIRAMEESILKALGENVKLQEGLSNLEDDRKAQELFILGIIEKQNSAMSEQVNLAARLAKPLVRAGINPDFTKNEASGLVPVAASGMIPKSSKKKERQGAAQGGYTAGAVDSMNVKGIGEVVYNKAEKVKKFPGMNQPAIMPPEQSRAGKGYKDAFAGQHGFDPYASGGFVPNFARMSGSKLILDPSLTQLSANPESVKGPRNLAKSYAELEASGQPISVEATTKQLLANTGGSHSKKVKEVIQYLQDNAGVESIEREFVLKKLPKRGRRTEKQAEDNVRKAEGKKYFSTGGRSGDPTFPVDLVGLGMTPIEVKSGEWKLPNVLLKSLRLYSDDGLMRFAESQGATEEMINAARSEKFKKGAKLLTKKGLIGKDASSVQTHQALLAHRMSEGLVPNFGINWKQLYEENKDKSFESFQEISKAYGVKDLTSSIGQPAAKKYLKPVEIQLVRDQIKKTRGREDYTEIYKNLKEGKYKNIKDLSEKSGRAQNFAEQILNQGDAPTTIQKGAKKALGKDFGDFQQKIKQLWGDRARTGKTIKKNKDKGKIFEEILSDLGGVKFEENKDAMDFARSKKRQLKVDELVAQDIGLGHPVTYGDAESGAGHGIKLMRDKLIRELHQEELLKKLLLNKKVNLPGEQFPDIVNNGSDNSKSSTITLKDLMKKGLKTVGARKAINESIKTNHGYTYDELLVEPKNKKKPTEEEKKKLQLKKQLDEKIISFNYVVDDVNLENLDKRTKTGRKVKELESLTSENVSGGLIPNFADPRTRSQKIRDTLADPSNKGIRFNKIPPSPANITSSQISRHLDIPIGKTAETQPSDEDIENAINAVAQTREKLQLPGYENLKSIDKTKILKKYKEQANKGKYYDNKDLSAAKGFVPNFADPLSAAISRERAAGVPQSRIRVEKSSQLKSAQNPMGFAVTNTRDEPAGVQQGIRRAKTMGVDPKKHGASRGMVPNFAPQQLEGGAIQKIQKAIQPSLDKEIKVLQDAIKNIANSVGDFSDDFKDALNKSADNLGESLDLDEFVDSLRGYIQGAEDEIKKIQAKPNKGEADNEKIRKLSKFKSESQSAISKTQGFSETKGLKSSVHSGSTAAQLKKVEGELLKRSNRAKKEEFKSIVEATKASQKFRIALDESAKAAEESEDDGGGLQRLFYLQSAISLVNGQFEMLAEGASGLTKTFADGMLAISNITASYIQQKELVSEGMSMTGVRRGESFSLLDPSSFRSDSKQGRARKTADLEARGGQIGKMGGLMRNLSGVGRMFGRFLPVVGQLYTTFTAVNEAFKVVTSIGNIGEILGLEKGSGIMDLLSTQGERAAKKLEKLGESTEKLQGALEGLNSQAENREKVTELEILGSRRTQKQELELQQLKLKGLDIDIKAQDALSSLMDENLVGTKVAKRFTEELSKGTNENEDYVKIIQEVIKVQKQQAAFLTGSKSFADLIDKRLDKFTAGSGDAEFLKSAAKVRGSQIGMGLSSVAAGSEDMDIKDRLAILNKNIQALEKESSSATFNMGDVGRLTKRLTKNLQGTENFDAGMMSSQIKSFIENVDESIDNLGGLEDIETDAVNAGIKQIVVQLNNFKKSLKGESDRNKEAQLKKEYVTAYKNIIFNIEQFRKNEAQLTKLSLESLSHQNKLNSSQQSLLLEYNAIGKEAAISSDFARKRNEMEAKFIADKQGIELKTIESLNKLRDTYFDTGQLAQAFKKDGADAAIAVQALKNNIKKGVTDADFSEIGKIIEIDQGAMDEISKAFEEVAKETQDSASSLQVVSGLIEKYGKSMSGVTASAFLLTLHQKELVKITDEDLNLLKSGLLSRKRQLELLNKSNKETQELLELEEEHKFIKEKTVTGAAKLYKILEKRVRTEDDVLDSVRGEAATLAVLNDFYKKDVSILAKSSDAMELGFQKQVEKNRTDAVSAVHSLRMLEAQTGSLKISDDSLIILESKLKSETENAKLALQESQFRLEYLSDQSKRSELVGLQLAKEMADLKTSNLLAAEKNLQLSSGKKLSELVGEQLNATLHSSRLEALTAAENALLLTGKTKQVKLIQEANELQEASNKLTELQNAVTKAGVSDKTLRMTTTADIGIEKANSILGTRTAGMKATVEPNAENMLAYANSLEQTNKLLGNGSRVMDRFRTKMAEINVEAENLGADLVDIGIDNARSGLKQMFDDIGSGAKSAKEAWSDFGLGLAKTLLDRMTQNNIDKIVKNLTFAFTGEEGKSDAEKIASETSHLVGVNEGIISSNLDLISAIRDQTEALKSQIQSETPVNKPKTDLIPGSKPRSEDPLAAAKATAAKQEISRMLDEEENAYTKKLERLNKPKPKLEPLTTINRGITGPAMRDSQKKVGIPELLNENNALEAKLEELESKKKKIEKYTSLPLLEPPKHYAPYSQTSYSAPEVPMKSARDMDLAREQKSLNELKILKKEEEKRRVTSSEIASDNKKTSSLRVESIEDIERLDKSIADLNKKIKAGEEKVNELKSIDVQGVVKEMNDLKAAIAVVKTKIVSESETPVITRSPPPPATTTIANKFSGGKIQHFAKGGFVDGPAGVDKVPAMLTAGEYVVPKEQAKQFKQSGGEIQNFSIGGMAKELNNKNTKNRAIRGAQGVTQLLVMNEVARGMAKYLEKPKDDSPPTFDKNKFNNLDLRSDVNIKRGDPRLSARFLAKDPVMQEYKDYLLEKAAYDVEKKNQKVDKKMQTIGSIVSFMSSFAIGQMSEVMAPYVQKAVGWAKDKAINTAKGHTGFGKDSGAFKLARSQGLNANYKDVSNHIETGEPLVINNKGYHLMSGRNERTKWEYINNSPKSHRQIMRGQKIGIDENNASMLKRARGYQSGGSIPAMLTAGEGFVPAPVAKRIGYDNLNRMNTTGGLPIVQGKGGIDNVGPVGLTEGDFIIKKSSTDKLLRENPNMMRFALQNPEGFKRGEQGYYEGGVVGSPSTIPAPSVPKQAPTNRLKGADPVEMLNQSFNQKQEAAAAPQQKSEVTNNINVNVSIDQTGKETVSTENSNSSYEEEQQLSLKIKSAVLDVIRQEKRIGGELSS